MEPRRINYIRNFIFGVEDSLVSTVGLLSGIAVAGTDVKTIILAGVVLIFVEAFSMGAGTVLSENASREVALREEQPVLYSFRSGLVMFVSYFVAGFIPLAPYLAFSVATAFWLSIGFSLVALFILGWIGAKLARISPLRQGLEMLVIGGVAITLGALVGNFISAL